MRPRTSAFVFLAALAPLARAGDIGPGIDDLLRSLPPGKSPGAAIAVVRGGRAVLTRCYGMADVARQTPITPRTIFRLASVTKPFTALAILQLHERRKLSIDDPVSKYLPEFVHSQVRIAHLLSHTSGVTDFISTEDALKRPLEFEPGTRISYSNPGYQLLGKIVERVSGLAYEDYLRKHIFGPLGMRNSGYDKTAALPGRATPYLLEKDGSYKPVETGDVAGAFAAGGLYSTLEDLIRFERGLASGKVLHPAALDRASVPTALSSGRKVAYGRGWMTRTHRGLREAGHGGDITGFNTFIARYPDQKAAVIVLSNTGMNPPGPIPTAGDLAHKVAEMYLDAVMEKPSARPDIRISREVLDGYCGRYKVEAPPAVLLNMGEIMTISREGDGLIASVGTLRLPLDAHSHSTFQAAGSPAELTFVQTPGERKAGEFIISLLGVREYRARRIE